MLILRDAFAGVTRFDDFQANLGIAPNMLTRRLAALVEGGLLERRRYQEHPPRDEYVLTACGRDFKPVLAALVAFGRRHYPAPRRKAHPRYAGVFSDPESAPEGSGKARA
jgi:DNA-binding HxlR family transcriptional regulator